MFTREQLTPFDKNTLVDLILAYQEQVLSLTKRVFELELDHLPGGYLF